VPDIQAIFDQLIACEGIGNFTDEIAIARIGILIAVSSDLNRDDGIARALHWCDELAGRTLAEADAALIEYFRANVWATREQRRRKDDEAVWDWGATGTPAANPPFARSGATPRLRKAGFFPPLPDFNESR